MDAKEYLEQVRKVDKLIENKISELAQWQSIAEGTSAGGTGERVQTSSSLQKMEDAVIKIVSIQEEMKETISKYINTKQEVIETIEKLEPTSYDILHKIYIQGMQLPEIMVTYQTTMRSILRKKGKALKQLQCILNERSKNE